LANKKQGKVEIYEYGCLKRIKNLLKSPNNKIQLNIIQLMANLAEHPKIREELQECLTELNSLISNSKTSEVTKKFSKTAIDVITWKP